MQRVRDGGAQLLIVGEAAYPTALAALDVPPPVIYAKGDIGLLQRPTIGIVGSRLCSAAGAKLARIFAAEIGRGGFVIASGLARGIDRAAHEAALDTGTVAVLAGGLDIVYPPEHDDLQRTIGERGCLVTEMPFGFAPRGKDFPRRNRIVSGLVAGRAHRRGGAAFRQPRHGAAGRRAGPRGVRRAGSPARSARRRHQQAAEVGRHAGDRTRRRPLRLTPLTRVAASGNRLREDPVTTAPTPPGLSSAERDPVVAALGPAPIDVDSLVRCTGLTIRSVQVALLELALAGRIERHGSGLVSLGDALDGLEG